MTDHRSRATNYGDERPETSDARRNSPPARSCANCAYANSVPPGGVSILLGAWFARLMCTNHPDSPGELCEVCPTATCRNFRKRWEPPVRVEPPRPRSKKVRHIALTKGRYAIVDAADFERLNKYKWSAMVVGKKCYAYRNDGRGCVLMHREIMNAPQGWVVDHRDGNGLNNCRKNLRICTPQQNVCNRAPRFLTSRYKGVSWDKTRNKWRAATSFKGKPIEIGRFDDEIEAAKAHDRKAWELFGEFAWLNFPEELHHGDTEGTEKSGETADERG